MGWKRRVFGLTAIHRSRTTPPHGAIEQADR